MVRGLYIRRRKFVHVDRVQIQNCSSILSNTLIMLGTVLSIPWMDFVPQLVYFISCRRLLIKSYTHAIVFHEYYNYDRRKDSYNVFCFIIILQYFAMQSLQEISA